MNLTSLSFRYTIYCTFIAYKALFLVLNELVQFEEKEMNNKVSFLRFQERLIKEDVDLKVDKLNKLQLYLDKLSFANTANRAKSSPISCLSADELDKQVTL